MIKCKVIENFTLKDFKKLKNIIRKGKDLEGHLYKEDTFECDEDMAKYLTGENANKKVVVKIIEVKPKKTTVKDEENIIPLDKENIKKVSKELEKAISKEEKVSKKKTSKKK